jgi:mannose-6-phosphate isomerase-like protein (cupin superfamily)
VPTSQPPPGAGIRAAEVVLPCDELDATLAFFTERLGFRVALVFPADAPRVAVVIGHGLRVRLERGAASGPGTLRLALADPNLLGRGATELLAPNGTRIVLAEADPTIVTPPLQPSFVLTRARDAPDHGAGRAGMLYRDLVPGRQGGYLIASHILVPEGGPVPDYVHFHRVRFQLIYCYRGWVRVVYEDQGPSFVMQPGDCVLQPPGIRHRVLECAAGLEVIEVSSPAEHETLGDLELTLPTPKLRPSREFGGQRFARHEASRASVAPWRLAGFEARDLGIGAATSRLAKASVVRPARAGSGREPRPAAATAETPALRFFFVLEGSATLECRDRGPERVETGDAFVVPAALAHALGDPSPDLELLEVAVG